MAAIALSCPGIRSLQLQGWHCPWEEAGPLFEPLALCSNLESVKLGYMYFSRDKGANIDSALKSLRHLPALRILEVRNHVVNVLGQS